MKFLIQKFERKKILSHEDFSDEDEDEEEEEEEDLKPRRKTRSRSKSKTKCKSKRKHSKKMRRKAKNKKRRERPRKSLNSDSTKINTENSEFRFSDEEVSDLNYSKDSSEKEEKINFEPEFCSLIKKIDVKKLHLPICKFEKIF